MAAGQAGEPRSFLPPTVSLAAACACVGAPETESGAPAPALPEPRAARAASRGHPHWPAGAASPPRRAPELGGEERGGDAGIHVTVNEHDVGMSLETYRLEALHDRGGLLRVRAGANGEIEIGLGNAATLDEALRQLDVIMLPGMDDHV